LLLDHHVGYIEDVWQDSEAECLRISLAGRTDWRLWRGRKAGGGWHLMTSGAFEAADRYCPTDWITFRVDALG
jgi:hypothetical protein